VDEPEELKRVQPVIAELARQVSVPISIDTSKAAVARAALDAGAIIINDVTALRGDPEMVAVARESGAGVVLMHMQGTPQTMHLNPAYEDVVAEVKAFFSNRLTELQKLGLNPNTFCLDPGIGFGKRTEHNFQLLAHLAEFGEWGHPVCLGVSRKGLIDRVCQRGITERMPGSVALASFAMAQGAAQIFRVHDVAETRDAALLWQAIQARKPTAPIG
jgi:dihydropteroate synthase